MNRHRRRDPIPPDSHLHGRNYSIASIASSCQSSNSHFHQDPLAVAGNNHIHHRHSPGAAAATTNCIVSASVSSSPTKTRAVLVHNLVMKPLVLASEIVKSP
ncbi:uncharacterized protein PG998_005536 [Apiospora kogelbergensis]|uniref:uncharacterized protein n=1 Tax=Apiospora kogelbergensis TaxID=1337665 RepID=UPI00312E07A0